MLVDNIVEENSKEIDIESALTCIQGKELSHEEIVSLRKQLYGLSVKEINTIAKSLLICLIGLSKKVDKSSGRWHG